MTNQYQPLYCDTCRQVIEFPEQGLLEFVTDVNTGISSEFRVIHHPTSSPLKGECGRNQEQFEDKAIGDDVLEYYTGPHLSARLDLLKNSLDISDESEVEKIKTKLLLAGYCEYQSEEDD